MAEAARRTIVVCDSSKFGRRSLSLIMPVSSVHETITDRGISRNDLKSLREGEIEVTLV
jgi:DeoR family transcriptional regulator of aga operon